MFLLHDLIPIRFPEFVRPDGERRHAARMETIARHGDAIMVNSDATRDALLQYVRNRRDESAIPKLKFATAPLGVEAIFQRGQSAPWAGAHPYFVCVATIEPRKNHVFLLQLWQRLVTRQGRAAPRLVLVGRRGWENENALDLLERGHGLRESVLECGALPDRVLAELVSGARALLLPSLAEGFGLPVVEALCLGTPVVASDLPALREISCGVAELLDPMDGRAWLAALGDYARQDSPRRQQQLRRLAAFRAPRWEQHFHIFDALSRAAARPAEMRRAA
jgi:glycosyltransferase involved in cell wall biosynthesis